MLKYRFLAAGTCTCNAASCMYACTLRMSSNHIYDNRRNLEQNTTMCRFNAHYEIRLNIIEYNGVFHTCGREAVSLVSSDHSYTEPMCI